MELAPEGFTESVRREPLFAAEGMNLERAEAALDAIEETVSTVEDALSRYSFSFRLFLSRYPLGQYAIPIPFVRSFIDSERARRRFLAHPTAAEARRCIDAWERTQKELVTSVQRSITFHRMLYRLGKNDETTAAIYDVFGHRIVAEDTDRLLHVFEKNARVIGEDIKARLVLLRGEEQKNVAHHVASSERLAFKKGMQPSEYVRVHELELLHSAPYRYASIVRAYGPLSYTLSHFDESPTAHQFMLYVLRNNTSGITSMKVAILDTFPFLQFGDDAKDSHPRPLFHVRGKDVRYWYQCATNLYTMRDQQYWADIATIVDLEERQGLDARLVGMQKSSMLDLILGACAEDHRLTLANIKDHLRHGDYSARHGWYWLLCRTHPSIYYLPFNKSVWRISERANFLGTGASRPENTPYLSADVVLPTLAPGELEVIMRGGRSREEARERTEKEPNVLTSGSTTSTTP